MQLAIERTLAYADIAKTYAFEEATKGRWRVEPEVVIDQIVGGVSLAARDLDIEVPSGSEHAKYLS